MSFSDHRLLPGLLRASVAVEAVFRVSDTKGSSMADIPRLWWRIRTVLGA